MTKARNREQEERRQDNEPELGGAFVSGCDDGRGLVVGAGSR